MPVNPDALEIDTQLNSHNCTMTTSAIMRRITLQTRSMPIGSAILFFISLITDFSGPAWAQERHSVTWAKDLVNAAIERTHHHVQYDGSYRVLPYPMGDVPDDRGVCTDVVIRAYRTLKIDLQQLVHEDMLDHFSAYPQHWGLHKPDPNIDHRRVPNLQTFFTRRGTVLPVTSVGADYQAGDLVTWRIPPHLPHIGLVTDSLVPRTDRPMIVHNIGAGPTLEDMLFNYPITGHYRYEHKHPIPPTSPNH